MTTEECKQFLEEKLNKLGCVRLEEFLAWNALYAKEGFSEVFHPELIKQMIREHRIVSVEYKIPGQQLLTLLMPRDTDVKVVR